jgi:Polyketide cyclase / dehydrase and lipid transport
MSAHQTYSVTSSAHVDAEPQRVYSILADYNHGHPRILPKQFKRMVVERGGAGAGTAIRFDVQVLGRTQTFRAVVSEPEPGRVLVERNVEPNDSVTTFTIDPVPGAPAAQVTITTELRSRGGLLGVIERLLTRKVLQSMYQEELRLLEKAARQHPLSAP